MMGATDLKIRGAYGCGNGMVHEERGVVATHCDRRARQNLGTDNL
jgi:hypothetical protein